LLVVANLGSVVVDLLRGCVLGDEAMLRGVLDSLLLGRDDVFAGPGRVVQEGRRLLVRGDPLLRPACLPKMLEEGLLLCIFAVEVEG